MYVPRVRFTNFSHSGFCNSERLINTAIFIQGAALKLLVGPSPITKVTGRRSDVPILEFKTNTFGI